MERPEDDAVGEDILAMLKGGTAAGSAVSTTGANATRRKRIL